MKDLAAIEKLLELVTDHDSDGVCFDCYGAEAKEILEAVPGFIAEIRRLRELETIKDELLSVYAMGQIPID